VAALTALNSPALWAQAVAMRNSNASDWALLEFLAHRRSRDADIALSTTMAEERTTAVRCALLPVWRIPGFTAPPGRGRLVLFTHELPEPDLRRDLVLVVPGWPVYLPQLGQGLELRIPPAAPPSPLGRFLTLFERMARRLNRAYAYPCDLGSSPYPGHSWRALVKGATAP
jgi:hypothetical protein